MKKNISVYYSVLILFLFGCNKANIEQNDTNANQEFSDERNDRFRVNNLYADTIIFNVSNASLAPDYQFYEEYVFTANQAVLKIQKGEHPEKIIHKKMDADFWEDIHIFNLQKVDQKDTLLLDGAEERNLCFIVKNKKYTFSGNAFEEKINKIQNYFNR